MVGFHAIVCVLLEDVPRCWDEFVDHARIDRCSIGRDIDRRRAAREGAGEEHPCGRTVTTFGDEDVDDLPVLIDCSVEVGPAAGDLTQVSSTNHPSPAACRPGGRRR